jgi:beta-N-acetylhexosaminidase
MAGLDVVQQSEGRVLRGRKVGLIAHSASVTAEGRSAVDVLRGSNVEIVKLFAPEHGVAGRLAAGERVPDGTDPDTGLPVVSLYGEKTKPAPEDLEGIDALVFDLQDAGVRFYTYMSTMVLCLEAAAEKGIEFVVLDRPNPLGGERVEGPVAEARETAPASLTNTAPGPLVHGLTAAEMARYVNSRLPRKAKLKWVEMKGWRRSMVWADTGRAWINPSPNLRSPDAAIAYPGVAMLEATNVSEGRGSDEPFLLLGAPWMRTPPLTAGVSVAGFALEPARFVPRASRASASPKYKDVECKGLRVRVRDPRAAKPYEMGVSLLFQLRKQPEFQWRRPDALDTLLGTRKVKEMLRRGESVATIVNSDAEAIQAFRQDRKDALLYK